MHPLFRLGVAASVLIAILASLFVVNGATPVLADIVKAAEKHKVVKYKIKQTTDDKKMGTASLETVAYADLTSPRFRTENSVLTLNRTVKSTHYTVTDGKQNVCLTVLAEIVVAEPDAKAPAELKEILASKFPRKEATLSRAFGDFTPATDAKDKSILENLRLLEQHEDVTPVKDKRDGKELLKYRLEDGATTTTLWVDPATELPVRLEREILDHTPHIARNHWTLSDFEWDPKLPEGETADKLFSTTPPEGYQVKDSREKSGK